MTGTEHATEPISLRRRAVWFAVAALFTFALHQLWFMVWELMVNLLPDSFILDESPAAYGGLIAMRLLLWIVIALLIFAMFRFAVQRWRVQESVWIAATATSGAVATIWLFTIAEVAGGLGRALSSMDFLLLAVLPLLATAAGAWLGVSSGAKHRTPVGAATGSNRTSAST